MTTLAPAAPAPPHCSTCICGRRAPVQGDDTEEVNSRRVRRPPGAPGVGPGTISWEEHLRAYSDYASRYGTSQSAERLAERGGFSWLELKDHLGHEPTTWRPR